MQYRKFGNTGISVSALGFGSMRLPMTADGRHVDEEKAIPVLQRAYELGVNYFDTAPYYCQKESEIVVGKAIKPWRDKIYLSTKNDVTNASGADWRGRLETSLRKLDVDYVDFYHMWGISWQDYVEKIERPNGPLAEARRARDEGLIRHISFSFHDKPDALLRLVDDRQFREHDRPVQPAGPRQRAGHPPGRGAGHGRGDHGAGGRGAAGRLLAGDQPAHSRRRQEHARRWRCASCWPTLAWAWRSPA